MMHPQLPEKSIWGTVNDCMEIASNTYLITALDEKSIEHEGVLVWKDTAETVLSPEAFSMGQADGEWICYGEDTKDIPMYEVLKYRLAICKRIERNVMKQMEEIRRDGRLRLTDYFGECAPPIETPDGKVKDMFHVRNGIYLVQSCSSLKLAVHEAIADNYMTPMAIEYGVRNGEYLFYETSRIGKATCSVALNELKNIFNEAAALVISENSLYATLYEDFGTYVAQYNMCVPEEDWIPMKNAQANMFLNVQVEMGKESKKEKKE